MTLRNRPARYLPLLLACAASAPLRAQQLIGYVNTRDASVAGASEVMEGKAVLTGSASVTAKDHTASVTLGRGGTVRVCQTSILNLTESKTLAEPMPLLFSLDRGAIEILTAGTPNDAIMTPDQRFSVHNAGPLDLRLRIARNGDTCVDNRGYGAPTLAVSDPFGEAMYEVAAGQHVLFEHGSLREVVDNEASPCGCPEEKGMSIADAMLTQPHATPAPAPPVAPPPAAPAPAPVAAPVVIIPAAPAVEAAVPAPVPASVASPQVPVPAAVSSAPPVVEPAAAPEAAPPAPPVVSEQAVAQAAAEAAARAAALHPFPVAVSEGLAPAAEAPPPAPGAPAVPIAEALRYNAPVEPDASAPAKTQPASPAPPSSSSKKAEKEKAPVPAQTAAAQPAPPVNDLVHVVGRFFKRLFGG
jgi:hypothetical protein